MNFFHNLFSKSFNNFHSKAVNSSINNFSNNLKSYLNLQDAISILNTLPKNTIFWLDRFEEGYAVCGIKDTCKMYDIPINLILDKLNEGDFLTLKEDR